MSIAYNASTAFQIKPTPVAAHALDVLSLCHTGQRDAVADDAFIQCWVTARRAGKTRGLIYRMLRTAAARAGCNVLYLTTTIKRGVDTVWNELLLIARELDLSFDPNHTRHSLRLGNTSRIWISGCETRREADEWRGVLPRTALVCVDEAQDWSNDLLSYTYGSVIVPSLVDIGGAFLMAGTPGSPRGFFYDLHNKPGIGHHSWPLEANTHVQDPRAMIAEACRIRGCDESDPSIRREFFGEFVPDTLRQIFTVTADNMVAKLPVSNDWSYVIGADFGTVDATAVVVLGWVPETPHVYVVETQKQAALGASAQVALVKAVAERYAKGLAGIVGDPGGGGKGLIVDLRQEHLVPIEPAEKTNKAGACIMLRDGLRTRKVLIAGTESEFANELGIPEWDPDHVGDVIRNHVPDRVDGCIYAYRKATALHHHEPKPQETREEWQIMQEMELDRLQEQQEREQYWLKEMGLQR